MPLDDILEDIELYLPKYLSPRQKRELHSEIRAFEESQERDSWPLYLSPDDWENEILQGDGWHGFEILNFHTAERKSVSGLVLSNSCDVSPTNERSLPTNVLFSPLVRLSRYRDLLLAAGKDEAAVADELEAIRRQRVTRIFFLPEGQYGPNESIILLDNIHPHPLGHFVDLERERLFRLSTFGFFLLILKLSIHFSRMQEGDVR